MTQYRQGDIYIFSTVEIPNGTRKVKRDRGRIVLAYCETTGHAHAILDRDAILLDHDTLEDRFLQVPPRIDTARKAVAWTFGEDARRYRPLVET